VARCITIVFDRFFEADGRDIGEARRRLREKIEEWFRENDIDGSFIIDFMCFE